jgi:ribonuclease PH
MVTVVRYLKAKDLHKNWLEYRMVPSSTTKVEEISTLYIQVLKRIFCILIIFSQVFERLAK